MNIKSTVQNGYRILDIQDHIGIYTDLSDLITHVEQALQNNETSIALCFTEDSYLFSNSIRIIMQCFEMIKDREGTLALIHPNEDILSTFRVLDLDKIINIFPSSAELQ